MNPHVSVITLGVRDFARAKEFYAEKLGWPVQQQDHNWVCFILGGESEGYLWEVATGATQLPFAE